MRSVAAILLVLLFLSGAALGEVAETFRTSAELQLSPNGGGGVSSNAAIDVIELNGGALFATSDGLNFTLDRGLTWSVFGLANGLPSDNVSAMYSGGGRVWAATNYSSLIGGVITSLSDGVSFSLDNGQTWTQVDFSETGQDINYVWGGDRTVYDITGHTDLSQDEDWVFFTAFAGGLLGSLDGGTTWQRIYRSPSDSLQFQGNAQPTEDNRFFACKADTSHGDSLFLWVGTAGGIFQYVFAPDGEKLSSDWITAASFCDECPGDTSYIYLGGERSFMRGNVNGRPFISRTTDDGVRGEFTSAMIDFRGRLMVASLVDSGGASAGLAYSDDQGATFTPLSSYDSEFAGSSVNVRQFEPVGERLYLAAEEAGLYVSTDTGMNWAHIFVDSSDMTAANRRNVVNAICATGDTLHVGTDSGLVSLYLDPSGLIDSSRFHVFGDNDSSGARVIQVREQFYIDTLTMMVDSTALWTVNEPISGLGVHMLGRSMDRGVSWSHVFEDNVTYDINFIGDSVVAVGELNARYRLYFGDGTPDFWNFLPIEKFSGGELSDRLINDLITGFEVKGDTLLFLTDNGYALSKNRGDTYAIFRPNTNPYQADLIVRYLADFIDISGDWCIAMEVEEPRGPAIEDNLSRVWISTRPTFLGADGISRGIWEPVTDTLGDTTSYSLVWDLVYEEFAWNIEVDGDSIYLATNDGLIFGENSASDSITWDTIALEDADGFPLVLPGTPVYGVKVVGDDLWVGTGDRSLRIDLTVPGFAAIESFYVSDTTTSKDEVYAYPVPFSHTYGSAVDFHFVVEQQTNVTLEIYDFAMNLVARVIDNEPYPPGIYPSDGALRRTWNGLNGNGDEVAVGVYYFKVEYSSGDVRWGKLAVMP